MVDRTINDVAQEVLVRQNKRAKLEAQIKILEAEEKVLRAEIHEMAVKANLTYGGNKKSEWSLETQTVPQVADWDAFYAYIHKHKWYHLLNRRPTVKSCQELWSSGVVIPGVERYSSIKVTVKEPN